MISEKELSEKYLLAVNEENETGYTHQKASKRSKQKEETSLKICKQNNEASNKTCKIITVINNNTG